MATSAPARSTPVKEIFLPATGVALNPANLVGAVSSIVWALMLVVTLKYVLLVLRADHHGGRRRPGADGRWPRRPWPAAPGCAMACCCWAWPVPRCSTATASSRRPSPVLGAMEGLSVIAPSLTPLGACRRRWRCWWRCSWCQRFGTAAVGRWFGPVIVLWFGTLAVAGVVQIARTPAILAALNPLEAWAFLSGRRLPTCCPRWAPSCWR